jgi:hypothetical protein
VDVATIGPGRHVAISNCGQVAIQQGNVAGATISNAGVSGADTYGIRTSGTISNTVVSDFVGTGIECDGCTIAGDVTVKNTYGNGVVLAPSSSTGANTSIDGLTATMNYGDGVHCSAQTVLEVRNSVLTGNVGNGLLAFANCALDLGSVGDPGNNEFNRTSQKNGRSGLCLLQTRGAVEASSSIFGCDYSGAGCTSGLPTLVSAATCQTVDVTVGAGVTFTADSPSCCP